VNAGYGFGDARTSSSGSAGPNGGFGGGASGAIALGNGLPPSSSDHPTGGVAGGQIGYNWQAARMVYGVEADLQDSWLKGSSNTSGGATTPGFPANSAVSSVTQTDKINYLGTVRGRWGYASDKWLAYATGGLAYGEVNTQIAATQGFLNAPAIVTSQQPSPATSTSSRLGWALGGGMELALSSHWSAKAEYLYYDLGKTTTSMGFASFIGPTFFTSSGNTSTTKWSGSLVRVGLNYRF
jgi:outer membrane immunogenic protein